MRVEVPPLRYLMIDGEGGPNTSKDYAEAVESLFSVAYAIKFAIKRGPEKVDCRRDAPGRSVVGRRQGEVQC